MATGAHTLSANTTVRGSRARWRRLATANRELWILLAIFIIRGVVVYLYNAMLIR